MVDKIGVNVVPPVSIAGQAGGTAVGTGGTAFSDMLRDFADKTVDGNLFAEKETLAAVDNDTELVDVVTAVANAEIMLDTVVTIRDRVIQAYQEIIRMPI
jgi:flagellar hook-basal body complex protein FliE